jgi:hypothetical protein
MSPKKIAGPLDIYVRVKTFAEDRRIPAGTRKKKAGDEYHRLDGALTVR